MIGPGLAIDTDNYYVVAPNMLGGCQGSTGPASLDKNGREYGPRFPYLTIRDQAAAHKAFADVIGVKKWFAIIGGSMGGMHALEYALANPTGLERLAVIAAPPVTTADQIALNSVQTEAIKTDPAFDKGNYYDAKAGFGPHRGLALARRMALLNYRSPTELNERFERTWQSGVSPLGGGGRFAVESYLDFHGNKFTRRFDANSYITLVEAMNSHDIGRDRGGAAKALKKLKVPTLVVGIDSDRLFPISGQRFIAENLGGELIGGELRVIQSEYGHDGFLIEHEIVGPLLTELLQF
jgi:homoserine O-acetyltransferase